MGQENNLGRCELNQYEHFGEHKQIYDMGQTFPPFPCHSWRATLSEPKPEVKGGGEHEWNEHGVCNLCGVNNSGLISSCFPKAWCRTLVEPDAPTDNARAVLQKSQPSWLCELLSIYDNESAVKWLSSPHDLLDGFTPLGAIRTGSEDEVAKIAQQLASGAYL